MTTKKPRRTDLIVEAQYLAYLAVSFARRYADVPPTPVEYALEGGVYGEWLAAISGCGNIRKTILLTLIQRMRYALDSLQRAVEELPDDEADAQAARG